MQTKPGLIIIVFLLLLSCGKQNQQQADNQTDTTQTGDNSTTTNAQPTAPEKITGILLSYYQDISTENIDESKYFAPNVEKFFNSEDLSRDKVGRSIRNGFSSVENRVITIDKKSLNIKPVDGGYQAEFDGVSTFNETGSGNRRETTFRNRVTFNEDFQIVGYEALDAPETASNRAGRSDSRMEAAVAILQAFKIGNLTSIGRYIHPDLGFYLLTQPGAMSVPYACQKAEDVYQYASWYKDGIKTLDTQPSVEALPDFDCGDMFSKQGCFMNDYPGKYEGISSLMAFLKEADLGDYDDATMASVAKLESYVSTQIIDTDSNLGFLLGEIDGKWYLLVMDMASYECSA